MQVGNNDFLWHLTARHSTANWRYYITKNGWNSSVPLERVSFDLEPFCSQNDYGAIPKSDVTMTCKVPEDRTGYHVIYGVWQIADTSNSFYQVVDVIFSDNDNKQPTEPVITEPTVTETNQPAEPVTTEPTVTGTSQPTKPVVSQPTETATTQPTESVTTLNTSSNTALSTGSNTTLNTGSNTALSTGSNTTLNTSLNTNLIVAPATATNAASTLDDNEIDILFHNSI